MIRDKIDIEMDNMFFIALCGPPGSGKSTVQKILARKWDVLPVDDGRIVRDLTKMAFRLSEACVSTQKGKSESITLVDTGGPSSLTKRQLLGKLARGLESEFGEFIIPALTINEFCRGTLFNRFSFGSVRRNQGWFYKKRGGVVVEILRGENSGNDFDLYDKKAVDFTIVNDGTLEDLEKKIDETLKTEVLKYPRTKLVDYEGN